MENLLINSAIFSLESTLIASIFITTMVLASTLFDSNLKEGKMKLSDFILIVCLNLLLLFIYLAAVNSTVELILTNINLNTEWYFAIFNIFIFLLILLLTEIEKLKSKIK